MAPLAFALPGLTLVEITSSIEGIEAYFERAHLQLAESEKHRAQAKRWCDSHRYRHLGSGLYRILQALSN